MTKTSSAVTLFMMNSASAQFVGTASSTTWGNLSAPLTQLTTATGSWDISASGANIAWAAVQPTFAQGSTTGAAAAGGGSYASSCTRCIMFGNVWCSQAWTWVSDEPIVTAQFFTTAGSSATIQTSSTLAAITASIVLGDAGLCCFESTSTQVSSVGGTVQTDTHNSALCPAFFTNAGTATASLGTMAYAANFWCSNGVSQNSGSTSTIISNNSFGTAEDKFTELMLIACRQTLAICGDAQVTIVSGTDLTRNVGSNAVTCTTCGVEATRKQAAMTANEKCSWATTSTYGAPTFKVTTNSVTTVPTNTYDQTLLANWAVHYVEFQGASSASPITLTTGTSGVGGATTGAGGVGFPLFSIANTASANSGKWNTAVTTLKARYYNVSTWYMETNATTLGVSTQQYGAAKVTMNTRSKYVPMMQLTQGLAAHNAYLSAFSTASGTYTPLATTYNTALAQVATNNALDATTKFFSPPAAVDVPTRPQVPVAPLAYTGLSMQTLAGITASTALAAGEVNCDTMIGGWGAGTAGLLTGVLNMEHSFGAFGADVSGTTGAILQAGSFSTVAASMNSNRAAGTPHTQCADVENCVSVSADATANPSYLIVSIIPTAYGAAAWSQTTASAQMVFANSNWKAGYTDWKTPSTPAAVTPALSTPTGAKMLAATTAAAVAVAAALF